MNDGVGEVPPLSGNFRNVSPKSEDKALSGLVNLMPFVWLRHMLSKVQGTRETQMGFR